MTDVILIGIILAALGFAVFYIYRAKKNGQACIGCPHSKECGKSKCNCNSDEN